MARENPIYEWPRADTPTLLLIFAFIFGLLALAGLLEWVRRRRDKKARIEAEWRAAHQISDERELSDEEWQLLEGLLRKYSPDAPHKAITIRQMFDAIVDRDLQELAEDAAVQERRGILLRDIRNRLGLNYVPFGQRIHTSRELYLKQVLWAGADKESAEWFRMSVTAVDEANFHAAPDGTRVPPFEPGQTVTFRMWREEDARYEFRAPLLRTEHMPEAFVFRHSRSLQRMQAREHFRLTYVQPVNVGIVNAPLDGDMRHVEQRPVVTRLRGRIRSLSAGGLAVLVQQPVPKQVLLRLELPLDETNVEVNVRLIEALPLTGGQYLLRGAFVGLAEADQEAITHFIFRRQQALPPAEASLHHSGE